jgi:hypothetical protein
VKDNVERQIRFAYVKIGDSITTGAAKLDKQYIFLISALCAMATSVIPRFLDEPSDNMTVAAPPSGCGLPLQIKGNGCAVYTLATICGASSRLKRDKGISSKEYQDSILPFRTYFFNGLGEAKGRAVVVCLALIRLYDFGMLFEWTVWGRMRSLFMKYKAWEEQKTTDA